MDSEVSTWVIAATAGGLVGGLLLLARGLAAYRATTVVADTSTSPIESIAAGEVRVSGLVEPAEMTLVSLLQSTACVYYKSVIEAVNERDSMQAPVREERSIGFQVRDQTGTLRVFPRDARFDVPVRFDATNGLFGGEPMGLSIRTGASTRMSELDRATAVADLLTVKGGGDEPESLLLADRRGRQHYREARLEVGDRVTIIGRALPFGDLDDPTEADAGSGAVLDADDPVVAADLAAAQASGALADDPRAAWGNAAIPGFGIGRPTSAPVLDPEAHALPVGSPDAAARASKTFDIAPDALVLAATHDVPLRIAFGTPGSVVARGQSALVTGLLGAILAIASAMALALLLDGGLLR